MYNQYLDGDSFVLLDPEPQPQGQNRRNPMGGPNPNQRRPDQHGPYVQRRPQEPMRPQNDLVKDVTSGLSKILDGVKQHFSLEKFDTGDILLVLIILFLYLEDGDNLELVITLGLLLLLGLDGDKGKEE